MHSGVVEEFDLEVGVLSPYIVAAYPYRSVVDIRYLSVVDSIVSDSLSRNGIRLEFLIEAAFALESGSVPDAVRAGSVAVVVLCDFYTFRNRSEFSSGYIEGITLDGRR